MKEHEHVTPGQIEGMLSGELSANAIRSGIRALLARCPVCMENIHCAVQGLGETGQASELEDRPADA